MLHGVRFVGSYFLPYFWSRNGGTKCNLLFAVVILAVPSRVMDFRACISPIPHSWPTGTSENLHRWRDEAPRTHKEILTRTQFRLSSRTKSRVASPGTALIYISKFGFSENGIKKRSGGNVYFAA